MPGNNRASDTVWLEPRAPGEVVVKVKDGELCPHDSDSVAVIVADFASCDWAQLPDGDALGEWSGARVRVTERGRRECPCCKRSMVHLHTEAGIGVIECLSAGQFYCYKIPEDGYRLGPL